MYFRLFVCLFYSSLVTFAEILLTVSDNLLEARLFLSKGNRGKV
jgi:hypothetical protein